MTLIGTYIHNVPTYFYFLDTWVVFDHVLAIINMDPIIYFSKLNLCYTKCHQNVIGII